MKTLEPFYPRSAGPLVTVFLPSRGRAGHLIHAIDSLVSLSVDPVRNLEIFVKVDDDDQPTIDAVHVLKKGLPKLPLRLFVGPRGNGYRDLHIWLNAMLPEARGDWIYCFNDDARMATDHWDYMLEVLATPNGWHAACRDISLLLLSVNGHPNSNEAIVVRRKLLLALGRLAPTPYADSWLVQVTDMVQSHVRVPFIKIDHLRETVLDGTRTDTDNIFDACIGSLISPHAIRDKMADAEKLLRYIEAYEASLNWQPMPSQGGWHYWRPADGIKGRFLLLFDKDRGMAPKSETEMVEFKVLEVPGKWAKV